MTKKEKKQFWARYHQFMSTLKQTDPDIFEIVKAEGPRYLPSISTEDFGKISYGLGQNKYSDKTRIKTTLGKFINRRLKKQVESNRVGMVGRKISAKLQPPEDKVRVLFGEDVRSFYRNSGIDSCMADRPSLLDLYVYNPNQVCLVTYVDDNESVRALLWLNVKDNNEDTHLFLDRIYSTATTNEDSYGCGVLLSYVKDMAVDKSLIIRNNTHSGCPDSGDTVGDRELFIKVERVPAKDYYPYIDSFYSTDGYGNFANHEYYEYEALNTNGEITLSGGVTCYHCEDTVDTDDAHYIDDNYYCPDCFNELYSECVHCYEMVNSDDIRIHNDEAFCETCYYDLFEECDNCYETIDNDNIISVGHENYCPDCYTELFIECVACGTTEEISKSTQNEDGNYLCKDCANERKVA